MPIYVWRCDCGESVEIYQSIGDYCSARKIVPTHCDKQMERVLSVGGGALFGDRHYDSIMAPDGVTRLDSRTKHRQYMKDHNLTLMDDYKGEWAKAEQDRRNRMVGPGDSTQRKAILEREFTIAESK